MVIRDCTTTGDGIVSALQVLLAVRKSGKTMKLRAGMSKLPQMINVRVAEQVDPLGRADIVEAMARAEASLGMPGAFCCGHPAPSR